MDIIYYFVDHMGAPLREGGRTVAERKNLYFALSHYKSSVCLLTPEDLNPRRPQYLHRHRAVSNNHQQDSPVVTVLKSLG
jgi:hypothetical protein